MYRLNGYRVDGKHETTLNGETMKIGYSRVATVSRQPKLQHKALETYGCQRFYTDIGASGSEEQPELDRLLGHLRPGDILVVNQLDQLSDSIRTLFKVFEILRTKNTFLAALEDGFDTSVPGGWEALKKSLKWSMNENLPAGTAKIYIWLDSGYGYVKVENCKTGIQELDELSGEAVRITGCSPEDGYPGFDVASYLVDTFGGSIERVEYAPL